MFNTEAYLTRIGFLRKDDETPEEQLIRLHRCHSLTVPFEDFDPFCGIPVSLDLDDIYEKVVLYNRGGYCFELNRLFQELLKDFGYAVKPVFCRPFSGEGVKLPLTHRMTLVYLNGEIWIVDVGLGGNGWIEPLRLKTGVEQTQWGRTYRIIEDDEMGYVVQVRRNGQYVMGVAFGLQEAEESDFAMSNYYTSTCPTSPFVNRMMCTLPTLNGRYTIRDTKLKIETDEQTEECELKLNTFVDVLSRYFQLSLTEEMNRYIADFLKRKSNVVQNG